MRPELYATLRERIVKVVPEIGFYEEAGEIRTEDPGNTTKKLRHAYRDIQLADVLRAISKMSRRSIVDFVVGADGGFFERQAGYKRFVRLATLNTALPLHLQEDAVGEYLLTVIK